VRLDDLGEYPKRPVALPAPRQEADGELIGPPPEFLEMAERLRTSVTLRTQPHPAPKQCWTREEVDQQESQKAERIARLRREGLLPRSEHVPVGRNGQP